MLVSARNGYWFPYLVNELFDSCAPVRRSVATSAPAVNVIEHKDRYEVEVAAPGCTREDFKVELDADDNLKITLEKKSEEPVKAEGTEEAKTEKQTYLRREFNYSKFQRVYSLPDDVDRNAVSATMTDGILRVSLAKLPETVREDRVIDIA